MKYLILQHPGHNWVFYQASGKLALAELLLATERLTVESLEVRSIEMSGISYLALDTKEPLIQEDLKILSRLSFAYAIFQWEEGVEESLLRPIQKVNYAYLDGKITSLLKYQGKTNELFTKFMLHVALLSSRFTHEDHIRLLDPVAGKGTTLFAGTEQGFDAFGIEKDAKAVHEAGLFFKKYLENERVKHRIDRRRIYGSGKSSVVYVDEFEYALSKEDFKLEAKRKKLALICGMAQDAHKYFKKEIFHLIVGDLPYGIQHSSAPQRGIHGSTRSPVGFLESSLNEWYKVLLKGGVVVLSWNAFLVSRKELSEQFCSAGFQVLDGSPYEQFEHQVDKSIKRDVIAARK